MVNESLIPASADPVAPPEKSSRRWFILVGLLLICLVVGGFYSYARYFKPKIATITVKRQNLQELIEVSGMVESEKDVVLKSLVSGQVLERLVPENQRVFEGTALARLDGSQYQLQLSQARVNMGATAAQARTEMGSARKTLQDALQRKQLNVRNLRNQENKVKHQLTFLERELKRLRQLEQAGVIPSQNLDNQRQQMEQARIELKTTHDNLLRSQAEEAEIVAARSRIDLSQTALQNALRQGQAATALAQDSVYKTSIRAPFNGSVSTWLVNRGDYVNPGTPVARLVDFDDLRLKLTVNELDLPKIKIKGVVEIIFDAYPNQSYQGYIDWISFASVLDKENVQSFPVKIRFKDQQQLIRPGMSGDARILVAEKKQVVAIPLSSVRKKGNDYVVDILRDGQPQEVMIVPGISTLTHMEVKVGLKPGDLLVTEESTAKE